jgi:hypothetical protein
MGAQPTVEPTGLPPKAVQDAQKQLVDQLSALGEQVRIVEIEPASWPDTCLGLGRPDEVCAQVITPGWRVILEINGQMYEVRTDETGSIVRLAGG